VLVCTKRKHLHLVKVLALGVLCDFAPEMPSAIKLTTDFVWFLGAQSHSAIDYLTLIAFLI
jgi:hypothetical protein